MDPGRKPRGYLLFPGLLRVRGQRPGSGGARSTARPPPPGSRETTVAHRLSTNCGEAGAVLVSEGSGEQGARMGEPSRVHAGCRDPRSSVRCVGLPLRNPPLPLQEKTLPGSFPPPRRGALPRRRSCPGYCLEPWGMSVGRCDDGTGCCRTRGFAGGTLLFYCARSQIAISYISLASWERAGVRA